MRPLGKQAVELATSLRAALHAALEAAHFSSSVGIVGAICMGDFKEHEVRAVRCTMQPVAIS